MSRSAPVVPTALLALTLTACSAGVNGTPGGSGVHDPYFPKAGNGGYDVTHYDLELTYDRDTHGRDGDHGDHLAGTATLTARATKDLTAFDLDLKGLDVQDVTVEGKRARWNRAGQELTIRPHDDLTDGETFRVTVRYSGTPQTLTDADGSHEGWLPTADGALALGEPIGSMTWFPSDNHPSDKATYDIEVTVPKGLQAVSNGELTSETATTGGRTTYSWHTAEPMATYLATIAVGHYDITRSTIGKNRLPAYVAVDPTEAKASQKVLAKLPEIMEWEEYNFGPYPFSSTGAIVDRGGDAEYALETQNRPVFPGAPDTETLVHELAHQWYGDSVTPKTWRDMWLNEGFATYAEWLWDEDHGGDTAQETFDALYKGDYYDDPADDKAIWAFPPARPSSAAHISDSPVYDRGAMVLHKIRETVGDDTFYDIIQGWARTHRHGNADTAGFTAYVEKKAPDKNFDEIWKDWLYGDGKPDHA
ncbi:M1 family metallopeptidase [Streptomyces cylindrosporus]|uniref:Aminopeptidase N n=1 Tax=Streptomyces cylindrosporus TaxID=2927583 RepID=A0ABS9Y597_9ACTN|nr:M1 family metallopeptidase [Streptomyces cylindrosporus]MCI3272174.1 M1 family metallopeptidase [Streptomyces cylindrosporus]